MTSARACGLVLVVGVLIAVGLTAGARPPGAPYASRNVSVLVRAPLTEAIVLAQPLDPAGGRLGSYGSWRIVPAP